MEQKIFVGKRLFFVCLTLTFFLFGASACNGNEKIEEYSAEQVFKDAGGRERVHNIFVSHDKIRMEMRSPMGKGSMVMIHRKDKGVTWTLFPEQKFYIESSLDKEKFQKFFGEFPMDTEKEDLGTETVNGFKCRKMRIKTTARLMGREIRNSSIVWKSDHLDFPVRSRSKDGGVVDLRNIKAGPQPAELFDIPAGYTKREMPFFNMGPMRKGRQKSQAD